MWRACTTPLVCTCARDGQAGGVALLLSWSLKGTQFERADGCCPRGTALDSCASIDLALFAEFTTSSIRIYGSSPRNIIGRHRYCMSQPRKDTALRLATICCPQTLRVYPSPLTMHLSYPLFIPQYTRYTPTSHLAHSPSLPFNPHLPSPLPLPLPLHTPKPAGPTHDSDGG